MNHDDELIHRYADGLATPTEIAEFEARLRDDDTLRARFLDCMNLDAALSTAAAAAPELAPTPARMQSTWQRPLMAAAAGLVFGILVVGTTLAGVRLFTREPEPVAVEVVDADFENPGPLKVGGFPKAPGWWRGDAAECVGAIEPVQPHSGTGMLRFLHSDGRNSSSTRGFSSGDQWQLLDLTSARTETSVDEQVLAEAEAWFNSVSMGPGAGSPFQLSLYAIRVNDLKELNAVSSVWLRQSSAVLATSNRRIVADADPRTWERVPVVLPLPQGTKYLLIHLSGGARPEPVGAQPFPGQFADSVSVRLRRLPRDGRLTVAE